MDGIASWIEYMADRVDDIGTGLVEHTIYIVAVVMAATITAVGIGILVRHRPAAREISLGIASVFLTLPSLALFTIFIPIIGLGFVPSFVALYLYALLPIMRNTVTGLAAVDPAVLESARGMGLSSRQRLWTIELPLAWPVIITGVRISALVTAGIAAIATLVDGGGLGDFIKSGLARLGSTNSMEAIWTGTVFIVALALTFDGLFSLIRRLTTSPGLR